MDTLRSWVFRKKDDVSVSTEKHEDGSSTASLKADDKKIVSNIPTSMSKQGLAGTEHQQDHAATVIDPRVAEYFKDFPEPYKTKAITRFEFAMHREYQSAAHGYFLEDRRDAWRNYSGLEQSVKDSEKPESNQTVEAREFSPLEESIRTVIPVHKDETVVLKLFQTLNFSLLGFALLWSGVTLKKRRPTLPKWKQYMAMVGSAYCGGYLQLVAMYRLMDWGPFDRTVDNRDALTKQTEAVKDFLSSYLSKVISEPNTEERKES